MNDTLELTDLEELLNDEIQCQSSHDSFECSHDVVARKFVACIRPMGFFICHNSYRLNLLTLENNNPCVCGRPKQECWRIVPV